MHTCFFHRSQASEKHKGLKIVDCYCAPLIDSIATEKCLLSFLLFSFLSSILFLFFLSSLIFHTYYVFARVRVCECFNERVRLSNAIAFLPPFRVSNIIVCHSKKFASPFSLASTSFFHTCSNTERENSSMESSSSSFPLVLSLQTPKANSREQNIRKRKRESETQHTQQERR